MQTAEVSLWRLFVLLIDFDLITIVEHLSSALPRWKATAIRNTNKNSGSGDLECCRSN